MTLCMLRSQTRRLSLRFIYQKEKSLEEEGASSFIEIKRAMVFEISTGSDIDKEFNIRVLVLFLFFF